MASRLPRSRATILVAVLLLSMALAAALAHEAWRAERSHRATTDRTLRDYAAFAAWEFTVAAKSKMYSNILYVFSPVMHEEELGPHDHLDPPQVILRPAVKEKLCPDPPPYAFRLEVATGELTFAGTPPSPERQRLIRKAVLEDLPAYVRDWGYRTIIESSGRVPLSLVYQVKWRMDGTKAAVYGIEFCVPSMATGAFQTVMDKGNVLPPALTKGLPNDSLFSVVVRDWEGKPLYASPKQYPPTYADEHALNAYGGLRTTIAINPAIADRLVIGGRPHSRLALLGALLGLTGVLVAIGLLQLRREHELARLREDFVASVSHELRTPLAQIRWFAELLHLGKLRSEDERVRSAGIIDQEARRLTYLVENVLNFSRGEKGTNRISAAPGDLDHEIRDALELFAPLARARKMTVVPALGANAIVSFDRDALRQMLLNLLDNAVKYGPAGQTITVGSEVVGDRARIFVEDEGPGIPHDERQRVWEPYVRLNRAAESATGGSGIGLSVVRELVSLHGGRTRAEGAPGGGARVIIELPLAHSEEDDASSTSSSSSSPSSESNVQLKAVP